MGHRGIAIASLCLLLSVQYISHSKANTHDVIRSVTSLWEDAISTAAKETLKAISKRTGQSRQLENVPLDTLKVFIGRQHHLAVELDGQEYEVTLSGDELGPQPEERRRFPQLPPAAQAERSSSYSNREEGSHDLALQEGWHQRQHRLALPEVTLTGPLELVLNEPQPVSLFLPHAADVGLVRKVLLAPGATARVSHMNAISLRRPVDLPRLPGQYLAEVYAHAQLGEPERGFHYAPGMLFMSSRLRDLASNRTDKQLPLLSFEVEPAAPGALSITADGQQPGDVAPRLKVKKGKDGTVELSVRPGQVVQPELGMRSLTHVWAWPLPHLHTSSWLPYESMLRGILASHPFNIDKVAEHGIPLKLTKSSMKGVSMMAFEMHLRRQDELEGVPEGYPFPKSETPLEIWEVTVQIQEDPGHSRASASSQPNKQSPAPRFKYVPMSVRRKAVFGNTFAMSEEGLDEIIFRNSSLPLGFESEDLGLARYAP